MDGLPVEIIGQILSRIQCFRGVIRASASCRQWKEAFPKNLTAITVNLLENEVSYNNLLGAQVETSMNKILYQTTGLQDLSLIMDYKRKFSASAVVAWLMHCRKTLRKLDFHLTWRLNVDILDIFGNHELEVLNLSGHVITAVKSESHRFLCLRSLSLCCVTISTSNLRLLVIACPRIENLELVKLELGVPYWSKSVVELTSSTLKTLFVEEVHVDELILDAHSIQYLHLLACAFDAFELTDKRNLKHFRIHNVKFYQHLNISEGVVDNLEILEAYVVSVQPNFLRMISKSSKLRWLDLRDVYIKPKNDEIVDVERVDVRFPQLSCLLLSYNEGNVRSVLFNFESKGCYDLKNVVELMVFWTTLDENFSRWIEELLCICRNVRKLKIHGTISYFVRKDKCERLDDYIASMLQLQRKYKHVNVESCL